MTSTNDKIRALFLAALMVLSVFGMTVSFAGSTVASHGEPDAVLGDRTHWQGQVLNYTDGQIEAGDVYEIRDEDDNTERERVAQADGHVLVPTSGLATGTYNLTWTNTNQSPAGAQFRVAVQDLNASFEDESVPSNFDTTLAFESNRGIFNVSISADGLDEGDLLNIFPSSYQGAEGDDGAVELEAQGGGEVTANFTGIDPGDYTFNIEVVDTDASASAGITVLEQDVTIDFTQSLFEEEAGDIAEFTIELGDTNRGFVFVGGENVGWMSAVEVTDDNDDGQVTIQFNSYLAGQSNNTDRIFSVGDDDTEVTTYNVSELEDTVSGGADFDARTNLSQPVEPGDYDLRVSSSVQMDSSANVVQETDVATLILGERSTDAISISTAPSAVAGADDLEELEDAMSDDSTIAMGDRVVISVEASGVYGFFENESTPINSLASSSSPVRLTLVQQNPGANRDPATIDVSAGNAGALLLDAENNVFHVIVDTRNVNPDLRALSAGQQWRATVTVGDSTAGSQPSDYPPYLALDEQERVSGDFSMVEATANFRNINADDQVEVAQDASAEVTGRTSIAPGSQLNVRLRASGDSPFLKTQTVTVEDDGSWTATFDMSDVAIGQEFDAQVRGSTIGTVEARGVTVEQVGPETPTFTPTPTPSPTPTPPPTTSPPPTDTPTDTPTADTDGQPGFGIAVAILALLAAALLAHRRRD